MAGLIDYEKEGAVYSTAKERGLSFQEALTLFILDIAHSLREINR